MSIFSVKKQFASTLLTVLVFSFILLLNYQFAAIVLIVFSLLYNSKLLLFYLLFLPAIETSSIVIQGFTISKLFYLFMIIYFIFYLINDKTERLKTHASSTLTYSFILLLFSSCVVFLKYNHLFEDVLVDIWFKSFPKLLLFFLLVNFYSKKGKIFFEGSLDYLFLIPISIPFIYYHFINNIETISWYNIASRNFLASSDPNEYTITLSIFIPIILFQFIKNRGIIIRFLSIVSVLLIISIAFQTASKSGLLAIFLGISISFIYLFDRKNISKFLAIFTITPIIIMLVMIILPDAFDFSSIISRFNSSLSSDKADLSSGRTYFWASGITGFLESPLYGHGSSNLISKEYNLINISDYNVFHNSFIQVLFQLGVFGFIPFLYFIIKLIPKKHMLLNSSKYFTVFYISLIVILSAFLTLSWAWKEIFWIICALLLIFKIIYYENLTNNTVSK